MIPTEIEYVRYLVCQTCMKKIDSYGELISDLYLKVCHCWIHGQSYHYIPNIQKKEDGFVSCPIINFMLDKELIEITDANNEYGLLIKPTKHKPHER